MSCPITSNWLRTISSTISAAQGELEREQNGRQTRQKMRERVKAGYWVFSAPVGFRYEKVAGHGKLLVRNEPIASIVKEALEGYASGRFASQAEIKRFLEAQPAFPKIGGQVHQQRVTDIMTRSVYIRVLTPSEGLFAIVRDMFKDAWDQIAAHGSFARETLEQQFRKAKKQADKLLDLIVSTDSPRLVSTFETRLNALESEKCLLQEKLATVGQSARPFDELLEHSLSFLANPWKLWDKGRFDARRTILKLVLTEPLSYHRETGARTPKIALPFKVLGEIHTGKTVMVRSRRLELPRVLPHSDLNAARLPFRHDRTSRLGARGYSNATAACEGSFTQNAPQKQRGRGLAPLLFDLRKNALFRDTEGRQPRRRLRFVRAGQRAGLVLEPI